MRPEMRSHREVAALAERQHGVVSTDQPRGLGFSASAINVRITGRRLDREPGAVVERIARLLENRREGLGSAQ
jgi:hypothetical protein